MASWLGWFMSFAIVILVPVDILAVITYLSALLLSFLFFSLPSSPRFFQSDYSSCDKNTEECTEPLAYLDDRSRLLLWRILYWSSFMLTW